MIRIEDVIGVLEKNRPGADIDLIRRAYLFSALHHKGQKRASGEPYLVHPIEVANILAEMRLDEVSVSTGLLHDVVEDTLVDLDTIRSYFGDEITTLVDGLTEDRSDQQPFPRKTTSRKRQKNGPGDGHRRSRRSDQACRPSSQYEDDAVPQTREAGSHFAGNTRYLCTHRASTRMGKMRSELEDLSFQNLFPDEYKKLAKEVDARRPELEAILEKIRTTITARLHENEVPFVAIEGRVKRLYSLWKKLRKQRIMIEQVYDLIATRIITPNDKTYCYLTLGVVHDIWTPVPERFKDWIAIPRDNLYRSLHTSVIGDGGQPFEVQIRTQEMHQIAEEGVAAHWKYKESKLGTREDDESLDELRKTVEKLLLPLVEDNQVNEDSEDFIESLKLDLFRRTFTHSLRWGRSFSFPGAQHRSTSRMRSIPRLETHAPVRRSTAEWCPSKPNCRTAM
jgi:GTP pyrophosphokinase